MEYAIYVEGSDKPVIMTAEKPELLIFLEWANLSIGSNAIQSAINRAYGRE